MLTKIQYTDDTDKATIISNNSLKTLVEEQNLFDGNFLVFSDIPIPIEPIIMALPIDVNRINDLETIVLQMQGVI